MRLFLLASIVSFLYVQIELRSMRNKILIIADKKVYSDSIREWIQLNCPEADVIEAASAEEALEKVDERAPTNHSHVYRAGLSGGGGKT